MQGNNRQGLKYGKEKKLGSDPFLGWIKDTREEKQKVGKPEYQNAVKPENQLTGKPENQQYSNTASQQNSKTVIQQDSNPEKQKVGKPEYQNAVKPENQLTGKPENQQYSNTTKIKKVTYYIKVDLIKKLKILAVETENDLSTLANEAIELLIEKYRG